MSNISKTVRDKMLEIEQETTHALSIATVTFDLGRPWTVINPGHRRQTELLIGTVNFDLGWCWTVLVQI